MDTVDKIRAVPTGMKNGMQDVPVTPVEMKEVRVANAQEIAAIKAKLGKK